MNVEENIRQERVARAAFNGSGVSRNNRLIERHASLFGAYWKSYDFANSSGQKNLYVFPLGPVFKDNPYDRYAFNLKVGNLLDRRYYESAGFTADIQVVPGAPRNLSLSMRVHF